MHARHSAGLKGNRLMNACHAALALCCALSGPTWAATQYTYDELNRLTQVHYDDGRSISYSYDAAGNLVNLVKQARAAYNWCGYAENFNTPQLPALWVLQLVRGGPGLVNNRLEARPTDSGAIIRWSTDAPVTAGTRAVVVQFRNSRTESYWGQFNTLEFKTASGQYWGFGDANFYYRAGSREFTAYHTTQPYGSTVAGTTSFLLQKPKAMGYGEFTTRITLTDGAVQWRITDAAGNITAMDMVLAPDFKVADLVAPTLSVYTTTGGGAWVDDLSFQCLAQLPAAAGQ